MTNIPTLVSWLLIFWSSGSMVDAKTDTRNDICGRFPRLNWCRSSSIRKTESDDVLELPPPLRSNAIRPANDPRRDEYCSEYQSNFDYYCVGEGKGDPQVTEFCPKFSQICNKPMAAGRSTTTTADDRLSNSDRRTVEDICRDYAPIAAKYCSGRGTEKGDVRDNCDRYRTSCDNLDPEIRPAPVRQPLPDCLKYQDLYWDRCASQVPVTAQEIKFCSNFANTCTPDDVLPLEGGLSKLAPEPEIFRTGLPNGPDPVEVNHSPLTPLNEEPRSAATDFGLLPAPGLANVGQPNLAPSVFPNSNGPAPLSLGSGTNVGNLAGVNSGTSINPLSGINTGQNVNAGPVGVSSGSGVNFGGNIPGLGSLSNLPIFGKRRRRKRQQASVRLQNISRLRRHQ